MHRHCTCACDDNKRYGGKAGRNGVKFHSSPPTISGAPTGEVKASINADNGKFSFTLKINDPDTLQVGRYRAE